MDIGHNAEKLKNEKSSKYFHAEAAVVATEDAGAAYQAPSLIAAGAEAQGVAMLSALLNLPIAFLYLRVPSIIKRMGSRKRAVLFLAILDAFSWLPLIAVMFFLGPVAPFWLVVLWLINLIPGVLLLPARDSWLADVVPANAMGRHLAVRTAVSATVYLGTFYIMGYVMDVFSGQIFKDFAIILLIAFVATVIKTILYSRMRDSDRVVENQSEFGVSQFLQETKGEGLGRFILYVSLFNFAVCLCSPLFAVYMLKNLRFSYTTFAIVFSSEFIAKVISAPFWGKYSGRVGNLSIVRRMSYLIPLVPILWLASSNVIYLVCVQLFSGAVWAGFDICSRSLVYRASSPEKRAGYIVYKKSLIALCQAFGALAGAGLLSLMIPVFGSRILGLFLLSGIVRFAVAKAMLPNVREVEEDIPTSTSDRLELSPHALIMERINTKSASRQGLYYRPQDWSQYSKYSISQANTANSDTKSVTSRRGVYYRPQDWEVERYTKRPSNEDAITKAYIEAVKSRRGLFFRPWDWADYIRERAPKATVAGSKTGKTLESKRGLFYQLTYMLNTERTRPYGSCHLQF